MILSARAIDGAQDHVEPDDFYRQSHATIYRAILSNTSATTTTFALLSTTSLGTVGGTCFYTVHADDGTDVASASGSFEFLVVNKAGTLSPGQIQVTEANGASNATSIVAGPTITG